MNSMLRIQALLGLLLLLLSTTGRATPPLPGSNVALMTVHVRFDDLNLSTDQGVRALESRVDAAARRACWITSSGYFIARRQVEADCYRDAVAVARRELARRRPEALQARAAGSIR